MMGMRKIEMPIEEANKKLKNALSNVRLKLIDIISCDDIYFLDIFDVL